jgi:hypothetical protein
MLQNKRDLSIFRDSKSHATPKGRLKVAELVVCYILSVMH